MEERLLTIPGNIKGLNILSSDMIWYEGEHKVAKQLGIDLSEYALYKAIPGLRMRGNNGGKLISSNVDAYQLRIIKIK